MLPIQPFREWYEQRHGVWPAYEGERYYIAFERIADAFNEYLEEVVKAALTAPRGPDEADRSDAARKT